MMRRSPPPDAIAFDSDEQRWQAVLSRNRDADAHFVYGVVTTGIYARPSSAARLPKRANVRYFDDAVAAQAAGFRASQRHCADQSARAGRLADIAAQACKQIDAAETPPDLPSLAAQAGLSVFHFHRLFKASTGLTPRQYAAARRGDRLRAQLAQPGATAVQPVRKRNSITDAIYDAGFQSNSRFYEKSDQILGMTPSAYRNGGDGSTIHFAIAQCTLGAILVAQSARGVCAIALGDDPDALAQDLQKQFPKATFIGADPAFEEGVAQVIGFVEAPAIGLHLPLDIRGTAFQERVWQAISAIPCGQTASYAEIAAQIGMPSAVRAVATACGANRLAVAIPCHRVVRRDASLSGYRWGVERKQLLLERERAGGSD